VLAYVFWHEPATGGHEDDYERRLARLHHSLARNPPEGFVSSATLRAAELPWLEPSGAGTAGPRAGYEDWYLVENWTALGVLEEAVVSSGHTGAHEAAARATGSGTGGVYRLLEGRTSLQLTRQAIWVARPPGDRHSQIADLLDDGFDPSLSSLFRRCLVLGPAPELCLLSAGSESGARTGVDEQRLPAGWSVHVAAREQVVA
jgi:hypothetical protein